MSDSILGTDCVPENTEPTRDAPITVVPVGRDRTSVLRLADALATSRTPVLPVDAAAGGRTRTSLAEAGPHAPADVAVIVPTSGSTATPKLTCLTGAALAASAEATELALGGPGRWLLALPATHIAGVQVILRAGRSGGGLEVMDLTSGFTADGFRRAAARLPAGRRYISLVPTQLARLADDGAALAVLADFDAVLVGGAALRPALAERVRAAGTRIVTTYGMSETCGGCVYDGWPLAGVRLATTADGRLRIAGPVLARGYLGRGDEGFEVDSTGTRWFVTSDLGELDGSRVAVLGRADDVIVSGGEKLAPGPLADAAIAAGADSAVVVGIPDDRWGTLVVVVTAGRPPQNSAAIEAAVRGRAGARIPVRHRHRDELPEIGPGKVDRRAVVDWAIREVGQVAGGRAALPDDLG